jgi:hypothetical protein
MQDGVLEKNIGWSDGNKVHDNKVHEIVSSSLQ